MIFNWGEGIDYCIDIGFCFCYGYYVIVYKNFFFFDIINNFGENFFIFDDRLEYKEVMKYIDFVIKKYKEIIDSVFN